MGRVAQTFLWLVIWALATSHIWKLGALLFAAAGLSNTLSLAYPPYGIVDYLWSTPLNRLIGMGVFNFADVLWLVTFPIFAAAIIRTLVIRLLPSAPQNATQA